MLNAQWAAAVFVSRRPVEPSLGRVRLKPTKQLEHSDHAGVTEEPAHEMPFVRPLRTPRSMR